MSTKEENQYCRVHPGIEVELQMDLRCPQCALEERELLKASHHALLSYLHGNSTPELAWSITNKIDRLLSRQNETAEDSL